MTRLLTLIRSAWTMIAAGALVISLAATVHAADPSYSEIVVSDSVDGNQMNVFTRTTPKIYVHAKLKDVPTGTTLTGKWIAEKTDVAPPNFEIDAVDLTTSILTNEANFSLSKPTQGWPAGDYRVELLISGKLAQTAHFKIAP